MKFKKMSASALRGDAKEAYRQFNHYINDPNAPKNPQLNISSYSNEGGHGSTRLPAAGKGQSYYECRAGITRNDDPGRYRFVFLVQGTPGGSGAKAVERYYTDNHYKTFYQLT